VISVSSPVVLVVDDDLSILAALERGLRLEGFEVTTAADGDRALAAVADHPPDAMVLDLGMPGLDGVTVVRRMRAEGHDLPVCILSARADVEQRVEGLQAGADDYMVKPFDLGELVARLQALLRRGSTRAAVPIAVGRLEVDPSRRTVKYADEMIVLTRREFDLLYAFVRHPGVVITRAQLLEQVWGYDFPVQDNAIDVFVGYLRRKLEASGQARALHTVRGVGFVLRPEV
jgi:two-component system response regulator PrrA